MRILVTGVNGQLGHAVMLELNKRGHEGIGSSSHAYKGTDQVASMPFLPLDITDTEETFRSIVRLHPDAVVHCSAWTQVDAAEYPENREKVYALNVTGPEYIAKASREIGAKLVFLSTDYVFSGEGTAPWRPDDTEFAPCNVYGKSKLEGEFAVAANTDRFFIVRSSWIFGLNGRNFVEAMLNKGKAGDTIRVVDDQIGTPTYAEDLSRLLVDMLGTDKYGYYHATNEGGYISWYGFAAEIFRQAGINAKVIPVTTAEYGSSIAARPLNSRMDTGKLQENGFSPLPDWRDALSRYLSERKAQDDPDPA